MLYLMARGRPSLRQTRKRFTPDWGNEGECERLPEEGKDPLSSQSRKKKKKEKKTPHIILSSWQVGQTTMVGIDKIQKINVSLQLICLQRLDRWCKWGSKNGCRRPWGVTGCGVLEWNGPPGGMAVPQGLLTTAQQQQGPSGARLSDFSNLNFVTNS